MLQDPTIDSRKSSQSTAPVIDNIPMFTFHVIFSTQGASIRSRSRRAMIQLLRREFIRMLVGVLEVCVLPVPAGDARVTPETLAAGVEKCWEADAIESQSSQDLLWVKISLCLYNYIATLTSNTE